MGGKGEFGIFVHGNRYDKGRMPKLCKVIHSTNARTYSFLNTSVRRSEKKAWTGQ